MQASAPLELLADASGAVTFGWADERVYYARFSRSLSARLGQTFAARLGAALRSVSSLSFFADARGLESYDLAARAVILAALAEQRAKLERVELSWWEGRSPGPAARAALGEALRVTSSAAEFEARLRAFAPQSSERLVAKPDSRHRSRWPLRR